MPSAVYDHLGSGQYSRLIYGAIIGLALTVALEHEESDAAVMVGTLVGTGVAVGLTELYSEFVGGGAQDAPAGRPRALPRARDERRGRDLRG